MRCAWCHNPETIAPYAELYWKRRMCVQCGACLDACSQDAINPPIPPEEAQKEDSTYYKIIRDRCNLCLDCVEACQFNALVRVGKPLSVEEILEEVERDRPFYDNSGGGMTLSGGEPTVHADFSSKILRGAKAAGIHTCLDTNGFCEWNTLEQLIEHTDVVLFDVKHLDPILHIEKTGVSNEVILENLTLLTQKGKELWVRMPILPGYNDSLEYHSQVVDYLIGLPGKIDRVDLLPFHNWCQDKYGWLGIDWPLKEIEAIEPSLMEIPASIYREKGFFTTVGGSGFENLDLAAGK